MTNLNENNDKWQDSMEKFYLYAFLYLGLFMMVCVISEPLASMLSPLDFLGFTIVANLVLTKIIGYYFFKEYPRGEKQQK